MSLVFGFFWFWCGALWMVLIAITIRPKLTEAVRHAQITFGVLVGTRTVPQHLG